MKLEQAQRIANRIVQILAPFSHKIHIAGSIRREKPEVKDIEIVVHPFTQKTGLFNDCTAVDMRFKEAAATFIDNIQIGSLDGRHCKIKLKNTAILCDMFIPVPDDYYRQLTIRTGSADYVTRNIAARWVEIGYCGTGPTGLRKNSDCEGVKGPDGKTIWHLKNLVGEKPTWQSEEDFFKWLQIPWIEPKQRNT